MVQTKLNSPEVPVGLEWQSWERPVHDTHSSEKISRVDGLIGSCVHLNSLNGRQVPISNTKDCVLSLGDPGPMLAFILYILCPVFRTNQNVKAVQPFFKNRVFFQFTCIYNMCDFHI